MTLFTSVRVIVFVIFLVSFGCTPSRDQVAVDPQETQEISKTADPARASFSKKSELELRQGIEQAPVLRPIDKGSEISSVMLTKGKEVYDDHCARCHGDAGDGQGELASSLNPPPLDFTDGVFKFRSTPTGQLPTDDDLFRTISVGVAGTSMSDYGDLREADRRAVVEYIKSFSPRFREEPIGQPVPPPPSRSITSDAVQRGQGLYQQLFCPACHGDGARGDGPLAQSLTDSNGKSIQPADLTKTRLKSGRGSTAIYRSIMTGLDG
ncbi:MAG: cytochrome c, partial [Nitrospirales bacterium]